MIVLGVDPGFEQSAIIYWDGTKLWHPMTWPNDKVLEVCLSLDKQGVILAIEQIEAMGMAVGKAVFETVYWSGRFAEAWHPERVERVPRHAIKLHWCGQRRAKDTEIRQAMIDRFGPTKEQAIGKRATPGPLFHVKGHEWSALAVAITFHDTHSGELRPNVVAQF